MKAKLFRRLLAALCAVVLALSLAPSAAAADFSDVKSSDWYYDAVNWAVQKGITTGTSAATFSPNTTCNNAQILTFLWRAAGEPAASVSNPFTNVSTSDYYCKPALWAYEKGLISGSTFNAAENCTRAMAVTYIWKAKDMPFSSAPASFSDVPVSNYQLSMPVAWAVENGITTGTGGNTFSPNKTCTRAEIVTFLLRAYGDGAAQTGSYTPSTSSTQSLSGERGELLKLINAQRSKAGLKALENTSALNQAAQLRADDISKGYFDYRPDGSDWDSVLDTVGVAATDVHESMLGGYSKASDTFALAMNTEEAYYAIMSADLTHVGIGYTHSANGYGGYTDFWSLLYITAPASQTSGTPSTPGASTGTPSGSGSFTPVAMKDLSNLKSLQKKATDDQLAQAYAVALEVVRPLAGLSREEQLQGIATALRTMFDSGMDYSTTATHYNDPYGYFVLGMASCAGCTRATGLCLNILGIPYEHVNEDQWGHQWCRVNLNGTYWICDAYGLYCGPEPAPYKHPYFQ